MFIDSYICSDCPRGCAVERSPDKPGGFCSSPSLPVIARAAPHFGEEPCISGVRGSGAIFFSSCNLRCVFCQNRDISRSSRGKELTVQQLADIIRSLEGRGVHNINLVTGTHFTRAIASALELAKPKIPVLWNSSGYELPETLKILDGLVDIYMPDYKYSDGSLAKRLSAAGDYPLRAAEAIAEMFRQRGEYKIGEDGMLQSGVLIRHLILPGYTDNTMDAIDFVADSFPAGSVLFSLMSQYTPMPGPELPGELGRTVSAGESDAMGHYMRLRGLNGYTQDISSAGTEMIPLFDIVAPDENLL